MRGTECSRVRPVHQALVFFLLGSVCALAYGQQSVNSSQQSAVVFHLNGGADHSPVKIVHVMLGETDVPLNTPVHVEGMWMHKLRFVIQNVSAKTVVEADLILTFPEVTAAAKGRPTFPLAMSVGRRQKHELMRRDGSIKQLHTTQPPEARIAPGALFTLTAFPDADMVQKQAYELAGDITAVNINFRSIYFDDESKWMETGYYIAVAPPTLWQSVTPEPFFARRSAAQK